MSWHREGSCRKRPAFNGPSSFNMTLDYLFESNVWSSRAAIKEELVNKIVYDDHSVFRRLRVDDVDKTFVRECVASFNKNDGIQNDMKNLTEVESRASEKTNEELDYAEAEDKENDQDRNDRSGNHGSATEKRMYDPLMRIFNFIANFEPTTTGTPRRFQKTNSMLKPQEAHTFGFPSCSPDITISQPGVDASTSQLWHHRDAFGEIKPSRTQGPKPANGNKIPPIVTQTADYARLFMSARPFMLFCVGILIYGTEFCVGIFDRDGITFSPSYNIFKDLETFIRVVRSLACNLSIEELGSDPTVRVLTDVEGQKLVGSTEGYLHAVVSSVSNDPRQWCTIGPPIWTSPSLLGRGTNVWLVREYVVGDTQEPLLKGEQMIMKTAWRSSGRTPESDIYKSIDRFPEGLAKFECGGDVMQAGYPITVQNLRSHPAKTGIPEGDTTPPTPVLHRLILGTVGTPLWEYKSDVELLSGFRDALLAHKNLCEQGILHRDISAGNILLSKDPNAPFRGFITDLEFAHTTNVPEMTKQITADSMKDITRTRTTFDATVNVKRGAGMTGTAQFMSRRILRNGSYSNVKPFKHEATHDLESFIWVLSYCVMRRLCDRAAAKGVAKEVHDQLSTLQQDFYTSFSQTTLKGIAYNRHSASPCLEFVNDIDVAEITARFMSKALITLFQELQLLIHITMNPVDPPPLTYDDLLTLVTQALSSTIDE